MKYKYEYEKDREFCHRTTNRMIHNNVTNKQTKRFCKHGKVHFDGPIEFGNEFLYMVKLGRQY